MPGVGSLRAGQYYAHPRNAFWPLMEALFDVSDGMPYAARMAALNARGVGLWDVLAECERPGSLDSAIDVASLVVNDIAGLLRAHPGLRVVALNGGTAARLFARHVQPALRELDGGDGRYRVLALPSTSAAHAARSFEQKRAAWSALSEAIAQREGESACA
jgi:hypoxanthine-DNA glycosylase